MTNAQVFGLGVVIVLGMALQAALMRAPAVVTVPSAAAGTPSSADVSAVEVAKIQARSAKELALIARGPATTLVVGDRTLVVKTDWSVDDGDTHITFKYYEYKDGKLVQVPVAQTVAEPR